MSKEWPGQNRQRDAQATAVLLRAPARRCSEAKIADGRGRSRLAAARRRYIPGRTSSLGPVLIPGATGARVSKISNHVFVVVLAVAVACLVAVVAGITAHTGRQSSTKAPGMLGQAWGGFVVRTDDNQIGPLPSMGRVAIVVSATCPHCHKVLSDLARAGVGQGLTVVVIQGLDAGRGLLAETGLHARLAAPVPDAGVWVRQTGVRSVPALLWFDASGHVEDAAIGELDPAEVVTWAGRTR